MFIYSNLYFFPKSKHLSVCMCRCIILQWKIKINNLILNNDTCSVVILLCFVHTINLNKGNTDLI